MLHATGSFKERPQFGSHEETGNEQERQRGCTPFSLLCMRTTRSLMRFQERKINDEIQHNQRKRTRPTSSVGSF